MGTLLVSELLVYNTTIYWLINPTFIFKVL